MENYNSAVKYADTSANSKGTANTKYNDAYLNSIEAKTNQLKATWQDFSQNLLKSDIIKQFIDILKGVANALNFLIKNIDTLKVAMAFIPAIGVSKIITASIPLIQNVTKNIKQLGESFKKYFNDETGKKLSSPFKAFKNNAKAIKDAMAALKEVKIPLKENTVAFKELSKETGVSTEELQKYYQIGKDTGDVNKHLQENTNLSAEAQAKLIKLGDERVECEKKVKTATKDLNNAQQASNAVLGASLGVIVLLLTALSSFDSKVAKVAKAILAASVLIVAAIYAVKFAAEWAAKGITAAIMSIPIVNIIAAIILGITTLISAIKSLVKSDAEQKKEAIEASKALQEEADALKEVSDSAKDACKNISDLTNETKKLVSEMNKSQWIDKIDEIGKSVGELFNTEGLSSLQAINKLLGTTYDYSELIKMNADDRLVLLDRINAASAKQTAATQLTSYKSQKKAADELAMALGKKEDLDVSSLQEKEIDRMIYGFDIDTYHNNKGVLDRAKATAKKEGKIKEFKGIKITGGDDVTFTASSAREMISDIDEAMRRFEEYYGLSGDILKENNGFYKYFAEKKSEIEESLGKQFSVAQDYIQSMATHAALNATTKVNIDFNVDTEETKKAAKTTYKELYDEVNNALLSDNDFIDVLKNSGEIAQNATEEELVKFIGDYTTKTLSENYSQLFDFVNDSIKAVYIAEKDLVAILDEVQDSYEALNSAMKEVNETGKLSASTIKKLTKEFPSLQKYVEELSNGMGMTLKEGSINSFLNNVYETYKKDYENAVASYTEAVKEYNALNQEERTLEKYDFVKSQEKSLNNAATNFNNMLLAVSTITDETLRNQYEESLEKQKSLIEEQADAYKTLCDVRKELLKTYQDEINAQKELEGKQKNVASLRTQVALLKLDNSSAGRAKAREAEAQLKEAEEELEEYTLETAINDIMNEMDKASDEYTNFVKDHLETIEEHIKNIKNLGTDEIAELIKSNGDTPMAKTFEILDTDIKKYLKEIADPNPNSGNGENQIKTSGILQDEDIKLNPDDQRNGAMDSNTKEDDWVRISIGGKKFDLDTGSVADYVTQSALTNLAGGEGNVAIGTVAAHNGELYIYDGQKKWRKLKDNKDKVTDATLQFLSTLNKYHSGGLVDNKVALKSNETFAKLLKGEFVSTPAQMDNFIKNTLPNIVNSANGDTSQIVNNAPLIEITCGNIDNSTMPQLNDLVNQAVQKIEQNMRSALNRTGYRK